jgi:hypothetical protein
MAGGKGSIRKRQSKNGDASAKLNGLGTLAGKNDIALKQSDDRTDSAATTLNLVICVAGIYASL